MSHQSDLISTDINAYLAQHEQKELLRLLTCGSVDDGKSTLIGRLLHDSKMIYEDQLEAVRKDSVKSGTTGGEMDLALLVDGLQAEREQGITIDVAYRYFSTASRKFIIADTPGHEQYTRNMATGASTCDLAVILIDARHGMQTQTRRHSFIASLLGIKHIVVAVNKMDLVDFSETVFEEIKKDYMAFSKNLDTHDIHFIPLSALNGDNVVTASESTPWYQGKPLMEILETVTIANDRNLEDVRFPVQYVNRPNLDFRGYCGTMAAGILRKGDEVVALPSGKTSRIKSIVTYEGDIEQAFPPMAVTLTLEDEIDISRGDLITRSDNRPSVSDSFEANLVWMTEDAMQPGRQYYIKLGTRTITGSVTRINYRTDVNTLQQFEAGELKLNEIGNCHLAVNAPIAFDNYKLCKGTGAFIIIDRLTNVTIGAGMITGCAALSEESSGPVSEEERIARYSQQGAIISLKGDKRAELATHLERRLFDRGYTCLILEEPAAGNIATSLKRNGLICIDITDSGVEADLAFDATEELEKIFSAMLEKNILR